MATSAMDKMQKAEEVKTEMNGPLFNTSSPGDGGILSSASPPLLNKPLWYSSSHANNHNLSFPHLLLPGVSLPSISKL